MVRLTPIGVVLALVSCGPPAEAPMQVAFRAHPLKCDRDGVRAKMQVSGGIECPLTVAADRTVSGTCARIPAGGVVTFHLIYFTELKGWTEPLYLATALVTEDLAGYAKTELRLVFPGDSIRTDIDDDQDGVSNIAEWCAGDDPRAP